VTTLNDDIIGSARQMSLEIRRAIPADHPSLAGHFPGAPVVPGVVILDEVAAALAEWRPGCQLAGVSAIKFLLPLKPEQWFTICFAPANSDQTEVDFFCRVGDRTIVEGRLQISHVHSRKVAVTPSEAPAFNPQPYDPRLAQLLQDYPASLFSERLYRSIELMERYSIDLAIDLLARLNVIDQLDEWRSPRKLCQALSYQPRFSSVLDWLLKRLLETGCIETRTDGDTRAYRLRHALWRPQLARLRAIGLDIDSANAPTLDLLDQAANLYPAIARGEQNAEQGLFEPQAIPLWLNYFQNENLTYAVNNWVGAVLAAERLNTRSKLRILELGAGAGSASEILLRWFEQRGLLPRIERYFITEPNAFFRRRCERKLATQYRDLPLEWGALDINSAWDSQRVSGGEFDLVYGVNVLHVAKDLLFSLNQAHGALAPDGWLVIGECVRPYVDQPIYPELIFQILDSFSNVNTDREIRPNPGFLTADQWRRAFPRAGFRRIQLAPQIDRIREFYSHFFTAAICGERTAGNN
jgi:3-hydroxymyristoyl/3-hydroxydecanoyl-(acyl carrier protein) dehydratase/SAM-dependent methyltransferase